MKQILCITIWLFIEANIYGQKLRIEINGGFEQYAVPNMTKIVLGGYKGKFPVYFDTASVSNDGRFKLSYPNGYSGMGLLKVQGTEVEIPLILLGDEKSNQSITFTKEGRLLFSKQSPNESFQAYTQTKGQLAEQLDLLTKLHSRYEAKSTFGQSLFTEQQSTEKAIHHLLSQIDTLSGDVGYFLRIQECLQAMNNILGSSQQPNVSILKNTQDQFERVVSLSDGRLWHSGILHRMIYSYYTLSGVLPGGHQHASDFLLSRLTPSEYKNNYTEEIIGIVQQVPEMAEYFSQKALAADEKCDDIKGNDTPGRIKRQLQQYTYLKIGMPAPDELLQNGKRISEVSADYKLIVFWASWCEHCQKEIPQLRAMYADLKKQNIEVIAMGMDDNSDIHKIVTQSHPWINQFVGRDWNAPITQHYYVFGTPTFFLVDKNMKIVAKPKSIADLSQWLSRNNRI